MTSPDDRYDGGLTVKTLPNGRQVYAPARPIKSMADPLTDTAIVVNETDRFDVMAQNVYKTPLSWWKIASANSLVNGSLHAIPGIKIFIPRN